MLKRYHYELIIYNNGLHGTGLPDVDYINAVENVIGKLRQISPHVAWRTTTPYFPLPCGDNRYPEISARREKMAQELMKRLNVPMIDCRSELEKYPATSKTVILSLRTSIWTTAARLVSNGALAGSVLQLCTALKNVYEITGYDLADLVRTTSWNQARALGLEGIGKIAPGFFADIVVLDGDFNVKKTFVNGELRYSC